jgi:hypothetical protein
MATTSPRVKPESERRADPPRAKSAKRSAVRHEKKRNYRAERERRKGAGHVVRRRQKAPRSSTADDKTAPTVPIVSPAMFIAACRAEVVKLEKAIAAAEALA